MFAHLYRQTLDQNSLEVPDFSRRWDDFPRHDQWFYTNRALEPFLVVVSTPGLPLPGKGLQTISERRLLGGFNKAYYPVIVQTFLPELAVEYVDRSARYCPRAGSDHSRAQWACPDAKSPASHLDEGRAAGYCKTYQPCPNNYDIRAPSIGHDVSLILTSAERPGSQKLPGSLPRYCQRHCAGAWAGSSVLAPERRRSPAMTLFYDTPPCQPRRICLSRVARTPYLIGS